MKRILPLLFAMLASVGTVDSLAADKGNVLVVISSEHVLALRDGKSYDTGYFLNELVVPVERLIKEGYAVTFANPQGNPAAMDVHSDSADFFDGNPEKYRRLRVFHDGLAGLKPPLRLSDVVARGLDQYQAVFFPGGHAPMQDLVQDAAVGAVLRHFHDKSKPTVLICHGPVSLLAAMPSAKLFVKALQAGDSAAAKTSAAAWPYAGYRMTVFSTAEEQVAEKGQLGGKVLFYPQDALAAAGGVVSVAALWQSNVVHDRELITGQNPGSDEAVIGEMLKALEGRPK